MIASSALLGTWLHAREEDAGGVQVLRPLGWALPPSRGRRQVAFAAGGVLQGTSPGPDDRPRTTVGSWEFIDDILTIRAEGHAVEHWRVQAAEPDRLLVRMLPTEGGW